VKQRSGNLSVFEGRRRGLAGGLAGRWCAVGGCGAGHRVGPAVVRGAGALAEEDRGARPGEGGVRPGHDVGVGWGLSGRHRVCCAPSPASTGRWPRTGRCRARQRTRRRPRPRPRTARTPRARRLARRLDPDRTATARFAGGQGRQSRRRSGSSCVCGRLVDRLESTVAADDLLCGVRLS